MVTFTIIPQKQQALISLKDLHHLLNVAYIAAKQSDIDDSEWNYSTNDYKQKLDEVKQHLK